MRRRRLVLVLIAGLLLGACGGTGSSGESTARDYFFFVSADPQINVPEKELAGLDSMVATMNSTPGTSWPFDGRVHTPRGVLVPGDLIDNVDNRNNWDAYRKYFNPTGEAELRFPVFAGIGNHDLSDSTDRTFSYVERAHIRRNKQHPAELNYGPNGYHYSWDWGAFTSFASMSFLETNPVPCMGIRHHGTTPRTRSIS